MENGEAISPDSHSVLMLCWYGKGPTGSTWISHYRRQLFDTLQSLVRTDPGAMVATGQRRYPKGFVREK